MRNNIIFLIVGFTLAMWFNAGTPPMGATVVEKVPVEIPLTDSQLYLLSEILQDRVPQYDTSKYDTKQITADYVKMQKYVKDDINGAVSFCLSNRGSDECNLLKRIKQKLDDSRL